MTRGGRRPGAGAPKGNRNSVRNLRRHRSPYVRAAITLLSDAAAAAVATRYKRGDDRACELIARLADRDSAAARELIELAGQWTLEGELSAAPLDDHQSNTQSNIVEIGTRKRLYISTPATSLGQSNDADYIIERMESWGWSSSAMKPRFWVSLHQGGIPRMLELLAELDRFSPDQVKALRQGPMGYFNGGVHQREFLDEIKNAADEVVAVRCVQYPVCEYGRGDRFQLRMREAK